MKKFCFLLIYVTSIFICTAGCTTLKSRKDAISRSQSTPIIYCTDLFHPPDDPDDHFDIATLLSMPEIDIKCVILDQGKKQEKKTGQFVLEQLAYLTGKKIPAATGLYSPLQSPTDQGLNQDAKYQKGIDLILKTLEEATTPINFVIVGSTRDVAAAYNRNPELFAKKVNRIHIFSGQASATNPEEEYNVKMDVHGFTRIMNSGLPITWNPCTDGGPYTNLGKSSFWNATHTDLLAYSSPNLQKFILYMLQRQENKDYVSYFKQPLDTASAAIEFPKLRALWGAALFGYISGRQIVHQSEDYFTLLLAKDSIGPVVTPYYHETVSVRFKENGRVEYGSGPGYHSMLQIRVPDPKQYKRIMTAATARLLQQFSFPASH